MRSSQKNRPNFKVVHCMVINGEEVEINPFQTDLPDRCKVAWAEMVTGQKHELVKVSTGGPYEKLAL